MKNFKVYVIGDNGIQRLGIMITCNKIKKDDSCNTVVFADGIRIDFDMVIDDITECN